MKAERLALLMEMLEIGRFNVSDLSWRHRGVSDTEAGYAVALNVIADWLARIDGDLGPREPSVFPTGEDSRQ